MWEDIEVHGDEEVDWYQITFMDIANRKCDAVAETFWFFLSTINGNPLTDSPTRVGTAW